MGNDIGSPFNRAAVYRRCKGIIDNKRYSVSVGNLCKLFDIENVKCRISHSFAKHRLCIRAEGGIKLLLAGIG